jgi:hypothetical protein
MVAMYLCGYLKLIFLLKINLEITIINSNFKL